jgi:hypothetical protein
MRRLVADDVRAHRSAVTGSTVSQTPPHGFFSDSALEPRGFFILSSAGTAHPVHFDASAFHTYLNAVDGRKLLLVACPVLDTENTPPKYADGDPFILISSKSVNVYLFVLDNPAQHL